MPKKEPMNTSDTVKPARDRSRQIAKSEATRRRIFDAAIHVLHEKGYAETTINLVQQQAGISRGALTHHFPSKQELMAAVSLDLLHNATVPLAMRLEAGLGAPQYSLRQQYHRHWERMTNSPEGLAFNEILFACRTDAALREALQNDLYEWEQMGQQVVGDLYQVDGFDKEEMMLLWSIMRTFFRGLVTHVQFVRDDADIDRMIDKFADIMKLYLLSRDKE